jgi:hypothetical protein
MRKILNFIYVACFLLALIIPFYGTNTRKGVASDFDNRMLVEFPEIGHENYEVEVESYLRDRIGFRDQFVTGYQKINDLFSGELTHPIYTYGQDGYMFFNMHYNIQYSEYHDLFVSSVVKMKEYCDARGISFFFMFDPEKISVYRQYLPNGVNYNDEWVEELLSKLRKQDVTVVDNREMLSRISAREQVFNRQYDAGHWNDIGAFYATNNLWCAIRKDYSNVTPYSPEDFSITTVVAKYLPSSRFLVNEEVPKYSLKGQWKDLTSNVKSVKRDSRFNAIKYFVNTSEKAKMYPKLLVFHGSYYNRCPEFFIGRASEYLGVHDYQNVLNLDYYCTLYQPDVVVFEVAEYTVENQYFSAKTMKAIDFSPWLSEEKKDRVDAQKEIPTETERVYVATSGDLDKVYYERELPFSRYVYLNAAGRVYDLYPDENGLPSAQVMHGSVAGKAMIFYEDFDGIPHGFPVIIVNEEIFTERNKVCSNGVKYDVDNNRLIFLSLSPENAFSRVSLQLMQGDTGEYIETIDSEKKTGMCASEYIHLRKEGWYRVRLKANGNKKDESVDLYVYLLQGKRYQFSFLLENLQEDEVVLKDYTFSGPCKWNLQQMDLIDFENGEASKGVLRKGNTLQFTTDKPNNAFNMVVLSLINITSGEQSAPVFIARSAGEWNGKYIHSSESGEYSIRLRGNSNLEDEYITTKVFLEEGMMYDWSFILELLSPEKIRIRDFSFKTIGREIE